MKVFKKKRAAEQWSRKGPIFLNKIADSAGSSSTEGCFRRAGLFGVHGWKSILQNTRTNCAFLVLFAFVGIGRTQGPEKEHVELPANLTKEVQRLGCVIPERKGLNVIRGEFGRQRITDWAVLCWKARVTTLLV